MCYFTHVSINLSNFNAGLRYFFLLGPLNQKDAEKTTNHLLLRNYFHKIHFKTIQMKININSTKQTKNIPPLNTSPFGDSKKKKLPTSPQTLQHTNFTRQSRADVTIVDIYRQITDIKAPICRKRTTFLLLKSIFFLFILAVNILRLNSLLFI